MKSKSLLAIAFLIFLTTGLKAQVITPFKPRYQVTQKGGIVFLSNVGTTCLVADTNALPPNTGATNNSLPSQYVDRDSDPTTFSSTSDSLNLATCSEITFAGLYWGGNATASTLRWNSKDTVKIKADNGSYVTIKADSLITNSIGFTTYHCFKDVTSIIKAGGLNARWTVANVVGETGQNNKFAGWNLVIVYKNDLQNMRQLTVFNGLAVVNSAPVDIPVTGFLTPPTGPVTFEMGLYCYDGDRSTTGDALSFEGTGTFVGISDAINGINNAFNSTIGRNGVLTSFRKPNYNNNYSIDADIFIPNNTAKNYIGNSDSTCTLRQTTSGDVYLTQTVTFAIDVYSPDVRVAVSVQDINGGTVQPGDTLEYTVIGKNIGSDPSINTFITDSLEQNAEYIPGTIVITAGPNQGAKTDGLGDDQADYLAASRTVRVRIGVGANGTMGGQVNDSPFGIDSTTFKFRVKVSSDCYKLACDNIVNNSALITGTGITSGITYTNASNPGIFDAFGCPIPGATSTPINASSCIAPPDTSISVCNLPTPPTFSSVYTRPGYVFYNSGGTIVTSPSAAGNYYAIYTAYAGCADTVNLTINFVCNPPIANGDNGLALTEDGANGTVNILSNDTDPQGNPSAPTNGAGQFSVDLNTSSGGVQTSNTTPQGVWTYNSTTGVVTFDPANNFNGTATLIYQLCDPSSLCDTAVITFVVAPVNDAPVANDDNGTTNEDTPVTIPVLSNDSDSDNVLPTPTVVTLPTNGTVTVNGDNTITYTPAPNFNGQDTFTYSICDGGSPNLCDTATVVITVTAVNDAPVANDDANTTNEDTPVSGTVSTNDSDVDGPTVNMTPVSGPSNGTIVLQTDGSYTYTPSTNFNGNDTLTYSYCDGGSPDLCDTAILVITVGAINDAPVANDDNGTTNEDTPVTIPVLSNDSDSDNVLPTPTVVTLPTNGTVTVNGDNTITYTPAPNFNGQDTFTYSICDGGSPNLCDTATVVITVTAVNDAPVANDDANTTNEDTPVSGTVSTNDSDVDGPTVNMTPVSGPSNGTIVLQTDGSYTYTPSTNFNGNDTLTYSYCDGGSPDLCDTAILVITVGAINDAPVANDDNGTTNEDTPVTIPVLSNDSDSDNVLPTPTVVTLPTNGTVTVNGDNTITYTPAPNFNGQDTFTYSICDGGSPNLCDTATVVITVTAVNDAPVANDDANTTNEDTPVSGTVSTNDSDVDGPTVNMTPVSGPSNGTIVLQTDGSYTYTPSTNFNGNDTLTYSYCDGGSPDLCDTAILVITVGAINDAPVANDDNGTTNEDTPVTIPVLSNDSDSDNVLPTPTVVTLPTNGTVTVNGDNTITYTPAPNFNGQDTFTYSICDGGSPNLCDTATVVITVTAVNDAPVANDDANTTNEDTPVSGTVSTNDSDVDGPTVNMTPVSGPSNGTIVLQTDGSYTYTPSTNFNGNDTLTYSYCDGGSPDLCDTAILVITVGAINDAPVANDDNGTTNEDTPVTIPVLSNDSDSDNVLPTPTVVTLPTNGTVTVNGDNTITYTPAPNFNGQDTFTYSICDGGSPNLCDTATVVITVTAVNDAPVANDDANTTNEDTPVSGTVSTNDSDVDGPTVNMTPVSGPSNGTIVLQTDGSYTYTPSTNFNGNDTLTYSYCDGGSPDLCDTAILVITVGAINDAPVANDDNGTTNEDTPVTIPVLSNDSDSDNVLPTPTVVTLPTNGTVTVNGDNTITYTPAPNFNGQDTFTYSICDGGSPNLCDTATVVITVTAVNDAPVANDDANTTNEDTPVSGTVSTNDSDVDGPTVNMTPVSGPSNGTIVLQTDGSYTYTPSTNFNGNDTLTYSYCDGGSPDLCDTAILVITVGAINDAPVANDDNGTTNEDTPVTIPVLSNDSDSDNVLPTPTVVTLPTNGTVTVNGDNTITYTPAPNFNGQDTFTYSICDGGSPNLCDTATVVITVTAVNDAPVANDDANTTNEDTPVSGTVSTNDSDVDGPTVNMTPVSGPSNGTIVLQTDGSYTYTPNSNFTGNDTLTYSYCDGGSPDLCDTAILVIAVGAVNDPPVIGQPPVVLPEDSTITFCPTISDIDVSDVLSVGLCGGPSNGTATVDGANCVTYIPTPDFNGLDSLCLIVCDNGSPVLCDTVIVPITVTPTNDPPVIGQPPVVTNEDTPVNFCPTISDIDAGDILTVSNCGGPTNGIATIVANCVTYTPNINYNGPDTLCLIVCDNGSPVLCDTVIVPIAVVPVDDAPIAENDINGTLINTPVSGNVSTNDEDPEGNPLVYTTTPLTAPQNGTVVLNADGTYTYTPNNGFVGVDEFQYVVCANNPSCDTAWVYINVMTVSDNNEAPTANNDVTQTHSNVPVSGNALSNDYDVDGDVITINTTPVTNPVNGTVVINANGTYTYTPNVDFVGTDEFTYVICDAAGLCDTATVVIDVLEDPNGPLNNAPFAQDDAYVTPVNTSVSGNVSLNDTDPNGDPLTFGSIPVVAPTNGTVVLNSNGTFTYMPNQGYIGPDQFLYSVCDNNGACDTATVYITVVPSPPLATLDLNSTTPNTPVSGNVLTNDEDPNGLSLTVNTTLVSQPSNGVVVINTNGTYTYTPNAGFVGVDTFYYEVCNPFYCVTVPVIVTVTPGNPIGNDAPIANDDQSNTLVNIPVSGNALNNDLDPDGDVLTTTPVTNPTNGTVVMNPDGSYTYTPNNGFVGEDEFTYTACDPSGLCDTATVFITITSDINGTANDAPFAQDDSYVTNEDTPISGNVSLNDSDPNGDPLTYNTTPLSGPSNGTVVLNTDGTFTYTPNLNYNGPDQFVYVVCDNNGACDTATVYILVLPVNDAPIAVDDTNSTPEETPVSGTVATNDSDVDGISVNITLVNGPSNGTIVLNADGTYTYTPNNGFNGTDTITYSYCDGGVPELCDTAILVITVTPTNDPPVAIDDNVSTPEDVAVVINVLNNDTDPENNIVPIPTIVSDPSNGTVVVNSDGTITYTPNENFNGLDTFTYVICDSGTPTYCDTAIVVIDVTPVADAPVLTPAPVITPEDVTITACFPFVTDNNIDSVSAQITCGPSNGNIDTIYVDGSTVCIVYTPNLNYNGPDEVCITLCDLSNGLCTTETIQIEVTPAVDPCYWLKGISPNGDGQNDAFYVNCNEDYPNSTMKVFNRWGDQVWDSEGHYVNNFEGKNGRNEILPDGTYYYIYEYKDGSGRKHAGFVQITR